MAAHPFTALSASDRVSLVSGSFPGAASAAVQPVPGRRLIRRWMFAAIRRKSIFRLVANRRQHGAEIDLVSVMFVLGDCLADPAGWPVPPFFNPHLGLHPITLRQSSQDLGFAVSDAEIANVIGMVTEHQRNGGNLSCREAGSALGLTRIERENARAWTMDAIDEPAEQRRARKAEEKKNRDRIAAKDRRRAERERKGLPPFDPEKTLRATAPWEALGISERTFYRRRKLEAGSGRNPSPTFTRDNSPRRVSATPPAALDDGEHNSPLYPVFRVPAAALKAARSTVPVESLTDPKTVRFAKVVAAHAAAHRLIRSVA